MLFLKLNRLILYVITVVCISGLCFAEVKFTLENRWPKATEKDSNEAVWKVKSGSKTIFKCSSSEKFQLVRN